jgi:hypothetical protein
MRPLVVLNARAARPRVHGSIGKTFQEARRHDEDFSFRFTALLSEDRGEPSIARTHLGTERLTALQSKSKKRLPTICGIGTPFDHPVGLQSLEHPGD